MAATPPELPPLGDWEQTKDTLHLWAQIVGKIRLATTAHRNHWWNVSLYLDVRGLTTRRLHRGDVTFAIDFDFVDHELVVLTHRGELSSFALRDGLSVAGFDELLHTTLRQLSIEVPILEKPYGVPTTTPFPQDSEHASYDAEAVHAYWRALDWIDDVFQEFAGRSTVKTSPVQLFWHSFDLALTRFSGRPAPPRPDADPVTQEAYSHELISFGFWAGDATVREPMFYSYTAPEPAGLRDAPLRPDAASWSELYGGSMALLPYDGARAAGDPRATVLEFLQSAYDAGVRAADWPVT
jgi:hypothetical protein